MSLIHKESLVYWLTNKSPVDSMMSLRYCCWSLFWSGLFLACCHPKGNCLSPATTCKSRPDFPLFLFLGEGGGFVAQIWRSFPEGEWPFLTRRNWKGKGRGEACEPVKSCSGESGIQKACKCLDCAHGQAPPGGNCSGMVLLGCFILRQQAVSIDFHQNYLRRPLLHYHDESLVDLFEQWRCPHWLLLCRQVPFVFQYTSYLECMVMHFTFPYSSWVVWPTHGFLPMQSSPSFPLVVFLRGCLPYTWDFWKWHGELVLNILQFTFEKLKSVRLDPSIFLHILYYPHIGLWNVQSCTPCVNEVQNVHLESGPANEGIVQCVHQIRRMVLPV